MATIKYKVGSNGVNLIDIAFPIGTTLPSGASYSPGYGLGGTGTEQEQPNTYGDATQKNYTITSSLTKLDGVGKGSGTNGQDYYVDYSSKSSTQCLGIKQNGAYLIQLRWLVRITTTGYASIDCTLYSGTSESAITSRYGNHSSSIVETRESSLPVLARNLTFTIPGPETAGTTQYGAPIITRLSDASSANVTVYAGTGFAINLITRSQYGKKTKNTDGSTTVY